MQSEYQILSEPSSANLLVTKRGFPALIAYFSGMQVAYLVTSIMTVVVAFLSARPQVNLINLVLGLILLCGWCFAFVNEGLAMGMRFIFSF